MQGETILLVLFVVATAVAIAARRFGFPYTVALVAAGLFLGAIHAFEAPHLTKELLFAVFLPALLFEAAYHIEFREFWRDKTTVLSLAVPGVAATVALTTLLLGPVASATHTLDHFGWQHALLFSALIAATDPIAVVGLFKSLGAPRRLAILVEGESLLNDGTSIVFFTLVLGLVGGAALSAAGLTIQFIVVVGGGLLVGIAIVGFSAYGQFDTVSNLARGGQGYASFKWYDSSAMSYLRGLPAGTHIYTNEPGAVYLYTGRGTYVLPDRVDPVTAESRPGFNQGLAELQAEVNSGHAVLALFSGGDSSTVNSQELSHGLYLAHKSAGAEIFTSGP